MALKSMKQIKVFGLSSPSIWFAVNFITAIFIFQIVADSVIAQPPATKKPQVGRPTSTTRRDPPREISVTKNFEPSFAIEPLSHRIQGRPNEVIPFQFKIESANRDAQVEIAIVGLRQEMNGQIFHDEQAEMTDLIRLVSSDKMTLLADKPSMIEGLVQFPRGDAKYHSFGILVRDVGRGNDITPQLNPDGTQKTQAGIRFVTQYILRLDLVVDGVRGEQGHQIQVEEVRMTPLDGRPRLQAIVSNPTGTAFEFELRARLRSSPSDRSFKALRLVLPVRSSIQDDTRYLGRILPKSRIRMEELLPEAIAGGQYEVDMELIFEERVVDKKTLPISVVAQDFPAQEVLIAQVGEDLQISPAQIELSQARGGSRRQTIVLKNSGRDTKSITLSALGANQLPMEAAMIQPNEIQLPPNGSRKLSITLRSQPATGEAVQYGKLIVSSKSDSRDYQESKELPLAIVLKQPDAPTVTMSQLEWVVDGDYPGFVTTLKNSGNTHLPLQALLSIVDSNERRMAIPSGFGRWLMPNASSKLEFRMEGPMIPGEYQLSCEILNQDKPITAKQVFTVTDLENSTSKK